MIRPVWRGLAAAALVCACDTEDDDGTPPPQSCEEFSEGYEIAAREARRCNPDDPDPCGGRALESLESQCIIGVPPGQVAQLQGFVEQYAAMGCTFGPPAPCPQVSTFRCEQDVNFYVCIAAEP